MTINKLLSPIFLLFAICFGGTTQAIAEDHYLISVANPSVSWLKLPIEGSQIALPPQNSERILVFDTNLNVIVSQRPYWTTATALGGNRVLLSFKANTNTTSRSANLVVKTKDGHILTLTLLQYGKDEAANVNKNKLELYGDRLIDSLLVTSNVSYKLEVPDWLKIESAENGKYVFTADKIFDKSNLTGNILIKDSVGTILQKVPVTEYYASSEWFYKPCFGVISDIHTGHTTEEGYLVKLPRVLRNLSKHDPKIRYLFVIGDLADACLSAQYTEMLRIFQDTSILDPSIQTIFIRGNHDNFKSDGASLFASIVNQPYNRYMEIQGYPFISLGSDASDYRGTECYNDATEAFLQASLKDANYKYPGKPIFVFQHILPVNTVVGSYTNDALAAYATGLDEWFTPYPQVIDFSGHTHLSIYDPHQIYQKNYTAVNDGGERTNWLLTRSPSDKSEHATLASVTEGFVVHFDKNNDVILERWNTALNKHYPHDWIIESPFDGTNFTYANRTGGLTPWWGTNASITVSNLTATTCKIFFPQAKDDEEVYRYLINVTNSDGTQVISQINQFSLLSRDKQFESGLTIPLSGLPSATQLTCSVVALDAYDQQSPAISVNFTLPSE